MMTFLGRLNEAVSLQAHTERLQRHPLARLDRAYTAFMVALFWKLPKGAAILLWQLGLVVGRRLRSDKRALAALLIVVASPLLTGATLLDVGEWAMGFSNVLKNILVETYLYIGSAMMTVANWAFGLVREYMVPLWDLSDPAIVGHEAASSITELLQLFAALGVGIAWTVAVGAMLSKVLGNLEGRPEPVSVWPVVLNFIIAMFFIVLWCPRLLAPGAVGFKGIYSWTVDLNNQVCKAVWNRGPEHTNSGLTAESVEHSTIDITGQGYDGGMFKALKDLGSVVMGDVGDIQFDLPEEGDRKASLFVAVLVQIVMSIAILFMTLNLIILKGAQVAFLLFALIIGPLVLAGVTTPATKSISFNFLKTTVAYMLFSLAWAVLWKCNDILVQIINAAQPHGGVGFKDFGGQDVTAMLSIFLIYGVMKMMVNTPAIVNSMIQAAAPAPNQSVDAGAFMGAHSVAMGGGRLMTDLTPSTSGQAKMLIGQSGGGFGAALSTWAMPVTAAASATTKAYNALGEYGATGPGGGGAAGPPPAGGAGASGGPGPVGGGPSGAAPGGGFNAAASAGSGAAAGAGSIVSKWA